VVTAAVTDELIVSRLRVVATDADAVAARLAAERLLGTAQPAARGLAPGQVLVIRTLRDPLPGAPASRWRDAVERQLEQLRATAARPAAGPVPADARAVIFGSLAELLACLALDAAAGVAAMRWWWRAWLGTPVPAAAAWARQAEHVPAALAVLVARGRVSAVARVLTAPHAAAIAAAVARAYGVGWPREAPAGRREQASALRAVVPEIDTPGLAVEHRRLVALGLALERRPEMARAATFGAAIAGAVTTAAAVPATAQTETIGGRRHAGLAVRMPRETAAAPGRPAGRARPATSPPADQRARSEAETHVSEAARRAPAARDQTAARGAAAQRATRSPTETGREDADSGAHIHSIRRMPTPPSARIDPAAVVTELGGLFLLPGVALYLGLYADFTRPLDPGIALDPWALTALLGRSLVPRAPGSDPAWALLDELRDDDAFRPPGAWRLPASWLEPFGAGRVPWRWSASGGRLRARHGAGFLALDVVLRGDPHGQLERELSRLGSPPASHDRALRVRLTADPLGRWVGTWLAPYVAARLRLALGARRPSAAVALTLRRRARVTVTPGRVDVEFSLAELPVAVRRAGLDRTPGWIPAARRHLAFHYV
jgi:hypothetical protein